MNLVKLALFPSQVMLHLETMICTTRGGGLSLPEQVGDDRARNLGII